VARVAGQAGAASSACGFVDTLATMQPPIRTHVLDAARRTGFAFELLETDPKYSDSAVFCEVHGYPLEAAANALLLASKKPLKRFFLCIVLGTDRLDVNRRVRELVGERLSFANVDEMQDLTGMQVGAVTPFGLPEHVPIYVDSSVMERPWVIVGAGDRGAKLKLAPAAIAALPAATIVHGLKR